MSWLAPKSQPHKQTLNTNQSLHHIQVHLNNFININKKLMNSSRNLFLRSKSYVRITSTFFTKSAVFTPLISQMSTKAKFTLEKYHEEKAQAKKTRTERYIAKVERQANQSTRRNPEKKNFHKNQFRRWFDAITERHYYLDREARRSGLEWKIKVGVMIERIPIVTPDIQKWDEDYQMLKAELSRYDEIAYPKELGFPDPIDKEVLTREELLALLPEGFTPAPRETEADKSGNIHTLDRQLKTRVYLSVRPDLKTGWTLPTTVVTNGETFLQAAKRLTSEIAGDGISINCFSNCPMVVDLVEYDDDLRKDNNGCFGEKIFYMRVQYDDGDVDPNRMKNMCDWGWLTRDEMQERVLSEKGEESSLFYKYML